MHKVVTERPRWNPGPGKQNRQANLDYDLLPRYQGMKKPYRWRKGLTDLLGPLRRWLYSQVGRPWNDVYSEACKVIRPDGILRIHVKTHLLEFVERGTFLENGEACYLGYRPVAKHLRAQQGYNRYIRFYVHPTSGTLQVMAKPVWSEQSPNTDLHARWRNDSQLVLFINGSWFECVMEEVPKHLRDHRSATVMDRIVKRPIGYYEAYDLYGAYIFCRSRRSLSKREIRSYGLKRPAASPTELRASVRSLGIMPNARPVAHPSSPDIHPLKLLLCVQICTRSSPNGRAETTAPKNDNGVKCSILIFFRGVKGCGVLTAFINVPRNISAPCADGCNRKSAVRGIRSIPRPARSPARGEPPGFTSEHVCCSWSTGTRFCRVARHGVMRRSGLPRSLSKNRSNGPFHVGLNFSFIRRPACCRRSRSWLANCFSMRNQPFQNRWLNTAGWVKTALCSGLPASGTNARWACSRRDPPGAKTRSVMIARNIDTSAAAPRGIFMAVLSTALENASSESANFANAA